MKRKLSRELLILILSAFGHIVLSRYYASSLVLNRGVSFGLYFPGIAFIATVVLIWLWIRKPVGTEFGGWNLLITGGLVNLGDRIIWGGVRDYWYWPWFNIYNNLPDMLIIVGTMIILIKLWMKKLK